MDPKSEKITAIALMSSGLDSLLAAKIVKDMGVEVRGLCFYFRFDNLAAKVRRGDVENLVRPLGIPLRFIDISNEFLPILMNPDHGWGSGVNPCIDCHLFMLRKAAGMMDEYGARFLITGEVVGQRPMSQNKPTLFHIDKASKLKGLILRPLSAKLMPMTLAEEKGWVDREKLFDFSGRTRTPQMELARRLGIARYTAPAGGCILTEPGFTQRAKALFSHRPKNNITVDDLRLLRHGRHFWPNDHLQVVVGRDEKDNEALESFIEGRWTFQAADTHRTPLVLADRPQDESDIMICAKITAKYIRGIQSADLRIRYRGGGREAVCKTAPASEHDLERWRV